MREDDCCQGRHEKILPGACQSTRFADDLMKAKGLSEAPGLLGAPDALEIKPIYRRQIIERLCILLPHPRSASRRHWMRESQFHIVAETKHGTIPQGGSIGKTGDPLPPA